MPLLPHSACGRRLTKLLITQQLGMFNSCHTAYIRMPRTTVTMSLRADWLYLEVFLQPLDLIITHLPPTFRSLNYEVRAFCSLHLFTDDPG